MAKVLITAVVHAHGSRQVVAATAAAIMRTVTHPSLDTDHAGDDVKRLVDKRLELIRPALVAQTQVGLQEGENIHSARGIIGTDEQQMANFAKHVAFNDEREIDAIPKAELKSLQRRGQASKQQRVRFGQGQDGSLQHRAEQRMQQTSAACPAGEEPPCKESGTQTHPAQMAHAECSAIGHIIEKETARTRPEASYRAEWERRVQQHQERYPGGTLPTELRSWEDYWARLKQSLNAEDAPNLCCLFCGKPA